MWGRGTGMGKGKERKGGRREEVGGDSERRVCCDVSLTCLHSFQFPIEGNNTGIFFKIPSRKKLEGV